MVDYGATSKAEPADIPRDAWVLELEDIESDTSKLLKRLTFGDRLSKSTKNRFQRGDILYGKLRPYLNKILQAQEDGFCTTEILPLNPGKALKARYLFHWLKHPRFAEYVTASSHGLNMPRLGTDAGRAAPFILAPLSEQKRIADKLDVLFIRLAACRERLDRVPAILKRFRQSVLTAATSGELTRGWRGRRALADWRSTKLKELGRLGRGGSKHRPRNDRRLYGGPYPFIQTGDIARSGGRIRSHKQTYSEFGLAQSKIWPAGTVCITIAANIADTAILEYPACFPDSVVGFVADPERVLPEFVKWSIDVIRGQLEAFAPATAQKNINMVVLESVEVQCPTLSEQREIVRRAENLLGLADEIERRFAVVIETADLIVPSFLLQAFRGELVPQDPNDEPASELLARINSAKAISKPTAAKKPGRRRS